MAETRIDVDDLVARFRTATLPKHEWTHHAHLVVGLWHVRHHGTDQALARLRTAIRRLNEHHGTPNSATRGYHETITRAYAQLLSEFVSACPASMPIEDLARRLLASPLAATDVLMTFYSRDRLMSEEARASWVEPDRASLTIVGVLGEDFAS